MTDLYWVRHGPTHQKALTGWRDVDVDLSDHISIKRLNAFLPPLAVVVSSDLRRAVKTADALQGDRVRLPHEPGLREFNFGDWEGKHFNEVARTHPDLSRRYWEAPGDVKAPNGESWNTATERAKPIVDRLIGENQEREIIAVAHYGLILTQLQRATGMAPAQALAQPIDVLSVTHLRHTVQGWQVIAVNHHPS